MIRRLAALLTAGATRMLRAFTRRVAQYPQARSTLVRLLAREDAIVPFGRALDFDPRTWVIKQTQYGFRIWVALGERSISREIMLDTYERDEAGFVQSIVRPGDTVVDVGANIGFYTALLGTLAGASGRVIACEPLANVANALEATIAENGFTGRTTVHRIALDARSGTVLLRHAPVTINQGGSYLAPAAALPPGHVDVSVPARTLDEIVGDGPCAFIKLDAEGAEPRIIAGGSRTFARCRPVMLAELNRQLLEHVGNTTPDDVIARMAAHGYVARRLRGPAPGEIVERYDEAATLNVVFSPLG